MRSVWHSVVAYRKPTRLTFRCGLCGLCFCLGLSLSIFQLFGTELSSLPDLFGDVSGFGIMRCDKLGVFKPL